MTKGKWFIIGTAIVALAVSSTAAAAPPVFILAGQSNMVGYDSTGVNPAIGPGVSFAAAIAARTGAAPTIIQCAESGSPLARWVPGGDLYTACVARARQASGPIAGVLFWQGESEASDQALASTWAARFAAFVSGIRSDLGSNLPVVFAQLDTPTTDPALIPYWGVVQAQQTQAATQVARSKMVVTSDLPTLGQHVTAAGYVTAGQRFADAMVELDPSLAAPPVPVTPPASAPVAPLPPIAPAPTPASGGGGGAPEPEPVAAAIPTPPVVAVAPEPSVVGRAPEAAVPVAAKARVATKAKAASLDAPGQNACYLFFQFTQNASTMSSSEIHGALKKLYNGGGISGRGAKDTSNPTLRKYGRRMLELEVSSGIDASFLAAARKFGNECKRLAK